VLFRVVREFALNVHKHAQARNLGIELRCRSQELSICVADDGRGFQRTPLGTRFTPDGGFGLFSIDAQVKAIGGHLKIDTAPGRGTRATVILPLPASWRSAAASTAWNSEAPPTSSGVPAPPQSEPPPH
jgi:signal transduction histidine kinase